MTYWVYYGDPAAMGQRDLRQDEGIRSERFSTDWEALRRARELLDEDATTAVAVCDSNGNRLSGIRLQLKLGYCCP